MTRHLLTARRSMLTTPLAALKRRGYNGASARRREYRASLTIEVL